MSANSDNPLIIQSNSSILLEVNNPLFAEARNAVSEFAHLDKSPEHIHTYSITPLSLWNAAALGMSAGEVVRRLTAFSKYPLPENVVDESASSWAGSEKSFLNPRRRGWC